MRHSPARASRPTARRTRPSTARTRGAASRGRLGGRGPKRRRPSAPTLTLAQVQEAGGVVLGGLGLLTVLATLVGGGPVLAGLHAAAWSAFGVGWPLPVAAALALGVVLVLPSLPLPTPRIVVSGAVAGLSVFGLLNIASQAAGGRLGAAIGDLLVALVSRPGAVIVLAAVLLLGVILAFRFSPGSLLLRVVGAARAAYSERRRLDALVGRLRRREPAGDALAPPPLAARGTEPAPSGPDVVAPPLWSLTPPVQQGTPPGSTAEAELLTAPNQAPDQASDEAPDQALDQDELQPAEASAMARAAAAAEREEESELLRVTAEPEDDVDEWEGINWRLPPITLLDNVRAKRERLEDEIKRNVRTIETTLQTFGVHARVIGVNSGPAVTQYELQPAAGVQVKRIVSLQNDLSLALAASPLRIEAPIPGKSAVGIEVPNQDAQLVTIRQVVESSSFWSHGRQLPIVLGNDVTGQPVVGDLSRMPHLLIAGATGQGKSSCINTLVSSLLLRRTPEQLRLVMVDPKRVELSFYNDLPHLGVPVILEPHQAAAALRWAVVEMDRRYKMLSSQAVRNIGAYNEKAVRQQAKELPYVVIVIDELADLMMTAATEVEELICRIAQLARAVGIHLVVATQRPSTDVITGLIKANMPSRIAFAVGSQVDSRVILDTAGAEKLLGRGDMLYQPIEGGKPTRVQGAFVDPTEVERLVTHWKVQAAPRYMQEVVEHGVLADQDGDGDARRLDPLFARAARAICAEGTASVSLVQRKFNVGYSRAGRIVDQLAEHRVVGAYQGSKSREILMSSMDVDELLERLGLE